MFQIYNGIIDKKNTLPAEEVNEKLMHPFSFIPAIVVII
jgi:hypothetical protein